MVLVTVSGPLNAETVRSARPIHTSALKGLGPGPIVQLTDLRGLIGATPEAYDEQKLANAWKARLHQKLGLTLIAHARVYRSQMLELIAQMHGLQREPERERAFTDIDDALCWLQQAMEDTETRRLA